MRPPPRPAPPPLPVEQLPPQSPPPPPPDSEPPQLPSPPPRVPPILNERALREQLSEALIRERKLESLIDELRKPEPRKRKSVFDSLRPTTRSGWAIGIAAVVTALGGGTAAVVTAVGGGAGLAAIFHAPELRGQIAALRSEQEAQAEKIKAIEQRERARSAAETRRWRFVGAALCKGALVTAQGVDCDAVDWEAKPIPKRNAAPIPWRAKGDENWPALPATTAPP